jgi:hypothetical protein
VDGWTIGREVRALTLTASPAQVGYDICRSDARRFKWPASPLAAGKEVRHQMFAPSNRVRRVGAAAATALALATTVPAGAHADDTAPAGCPEREAAQTFLPWMDPAWYVPAPDGGLERGAAGWTLLDGATVADGNEPFHVGGADDRRSLDLPPGAAATTAPMCLAVEHPTVRFFARNTGAPDSTLQVSIVYRDRDGRWQSLAIGVVSADSAWAPTPPLPVTVNLLSLLGDQQAAFRFAPADDRGDWSIDDIYVDPYGKG